MKFTFFSRAQHKTFQHIPIYYNEKEERIKELERQAQIELQQKPEDDGNYRDRIKGSMRRYDHQHKSAVHFVSNQKRRANVRVAFIIAILIILAYFLWTHTDTFIQAFMK